MNKISRRLTTEDVTNFVEIVGLGFKQEVVEVDTFGINSNTGNEENSRDVIREALIMHPSEFTIRPLNDDAQAHLLARHRMQYNEKYERWDIVYKDVIIYGVLLDSFENGIWKCHCDLFGQDKGTVR